MIGTIDALKGVIMKSNGVFTGKIILLLGIGCAVLLASAKDASAYPVSLPPSINLTIGDGHELGVVEGNVPPGEGVRRNFVNHLIAMALGRSSLLSIRSFTIDWRAGTSKALAIPSTTLSERISQTW